MRRLAQLRRGAAQRAPRVDELDWAIVVTAVAAIVARFIRRTTLGTLAADKPIGQERADLWIKELLDVAFFYEPRFADRLPNLRAELPVLCTVRAAVVVELDVERGKITLMRLLHLGNKFLFAAAGLPGTDHHRRAVRVVGTHVNAAVAHQLLESHPDVSLDVLHQVANVDVPIGVRQGRGDEDSTHSFRRVFAQKNEELVASTGC